MQQLSSALCRAAASSTSQAGAAISTALRSLSSATDLKRALADKIPAEQVRQRPFRGLVTRDVNKGHETRALRRPHGNGGRTAHTYIAV